MLGIATAHNAMAATMRHETQATRWHVFWSLTRIAAAARRLPDRNTPDDDRKEPRILRAAAILIGSSVESADGVDRCACWAVQFPNSGQ